MYLNRHWRKMIAASIVCLPVIVSATETQATGANETKAAQAEKPLIYIGQETQQKQKPRAATKLEKQAVGQALTNRLDEMKSLKDRAGAVTKNIAELAAAGALPTNQDAIDQMKKMLDEMSAIRQMMEKLTEEVDAIKGWIEGQNEALPIMSYDINDLKRNKWGSYFQTQYRDTDQRGGSPDAFGMRRVRISQTMTIDPKTSVKVSFDLATGTSQTTAQIRDAFLVYDIEPSNEKVGAQLIMGQQPLPLGYELERSSGEREFPERAQYNQKMFSGERGRGVVFKYGLNNNTSIHIGGWNSLSFNDPEQSSVAPGPESRLAMSAGIRNYSTKHDVGISIFRGERPSLKLGNVISPRVDRDFLYLDGSLVGVFNPNITIRAEAMIGHDRVPLSSTATPSSPVGGVDMRGWQVQLGYNINYRNQINFRFEHFDPNVDKDNDVIKGYGVSFIHYLNPGARVTLAHEIFEDATRKNVGGKAQQRYGITTLRVQFRF